MTKEESEIKIKYRSGIMHKGVVEGSPYREYNYDYVSAGKSSVKRYNNAIMLLMGISGCPHHLIDWLADNMTEGGYVTNNEITRRSFIDFHSRYKPRGNKSYSEHAVVKAFKRLADDGFLIQVTRGVYKVNPIMYFSGTDEDRIQSIKYMMEFKSGVETKIKVEVNKKS